VDKFANNDVIQGLHTPVTITSKTLYFRFIRLMMYIIFIIDHIHHLMNESKIQSFVYNSDRRVYFVSKFRYKLTNE
jgi:hypothetical protein